MRYFFLFISIVISEITFAQKECTIRGVVKDAETEIPISGATVVIYCQECGDTAKSGRVNTLTDSKGAYEFKKFTCPKSCSSYAIRVNKKTYLENLQFSSKWTNNIILDFNLFSATEKSANSENVVTTDKSKSQSLKEQHTKPDSLTKTVRTPSSDTSTLSRGKTNLRKGHKKLLPGETILLSNGTSAQVINNDTVNRIDVENYLQGKWLFPGKYSVDKSYYSNGQYMEGDFLENRKNGTWMKFFPNDSMEFNLAYKNDKAGGNFRLYFPNGVLRSKGFYMSETKEFKGIFQENYPSGHLFKKFDYDSAGLKNGLQYLYYPNQNISILATMKNNLLEGQTIIFFEDGSIYAQRQYVSGKLIKEIILSHAPKITNDAIDALMAELSGTNQDVINELEKAVNEIDRVTSKSQDLINERNQELSLAHQIISEQRKQLLIQSKHISKIELENKLQNQQILNQRITAILGSLLMVVLLFITGYVYKNNRKKTRINLILNAQKTEIEQKNREITDSINYAKRIQSAMLPPREKINAVFPESFIFFQPKDIVSGDFYWFYESKEGYLIAVADCTGHGVPGGFMSMIGSEKLSEAALITSDVSELLSRVNKGVKKALRQDSGSDSTHDGMDIVICYFDKQKKYLEYAAANRPLWIVKNSQSELIEIKATKDAIGGFTKDEQVFAKHKIELNKGDTIYLSSDGYADQFSAESKKLMIKRFKEKLISLQNITLAEQAKQLEEYHTRWKGNMEQTDDILVLGIKI